MNSPPYTLNIEHLRARVDEYRDRFMGAKPFKYVVIDGFLPEEFAESILMSYPPPQDTWDGTTYIHQWKKFVLATNLPHECEEFFKLSASPEFLKSISYITGIDDLISDPELFGGGLHQTVNGGFLNVHVDFNRHPRTKLHRRLNLLCYLNKNWKREYEGYLELWDMGQRQCIEMIAPTFNRCVVFETNEMSYHGHPKPLRTPPGITRKSLSVYYYTAHRSLADIAEEHNTIYRHTDAVVSYLKTGRSALVAFSERLQKGMGFGVLIDLASLVLRTLRRTPPPNR